MISSSFSPLCLLSLDRWHCGEQAPVLTACFFHNDFSMSCKCFVSIDIFPAHSALLPCQGLAESRGILTPSPAPLSLLCISVGNWGLTIFTSHLFHETRDEPMYPGSQVVLPTVRSLTFGLMLSWRNVEW